MIRCSNCGVQNEDNYKFCGKCGVPLKVERGTGRNQAVPKKLRKTTLLIILGLVILAALATVWMNTGARIADRQISSGEKYLADHKYKEASLVFSKAVEVNPQEAEAYIGLSDAYTGLGDTDKALDTFKSGLIALPQEERFYDKLGGLYLELGDVDAAISVLEKGIATTDSDLIKQLYNDTVKKFARGNSPGNINNGGIADIQGDWIYYVEGAIYKIRTDGNELTKIIDDFARYINVVGDWIYYVNNDDGERIYKIRTDGSERTKLNDDGSSYVNFVNDWIYYVNEDDGYHIYKIRSDGSGRSKLNNDNSLCINVVDDWIYYSNLDDGERIYKIRTDGSERIKISDDRVKSINVANEWIYYINRGENHTENRIYKIRTDGSKRSKVVEDHADSINVTDDWIYYQNSDDGSSIYKLRMDGSSRMKVNDDNSAEFNVTDDWIFYVNVKKVNNVYGGRTYKIHADGTDRQLTDSDHGLLEVPAGSNKNTPEIKKFTFDSTKQLSYSEYTINGTHISGDFGEPLNIESTNYDENLTGNRTGEFSIKKYYNGFQYEFFGLYETDISTRMYRITDNNVLGPRDIRVGDSFQEVMKKFPSTVEMNFKVPTYDSSEIVSSEMISSGMAEAYGDQYPSAVMLLSDIAGKKHLDCLIYTNEYSTGYLSVSIVFNKDMVSEIRIYT